MAGCWVAGSGGNTTEEVWLPPRGGMMIGVVRSVRRGVASGYELLLLRSSVNQDTGGPPVLIFTADPSGQAATDFRVTRADPGFLRVENPEHDFPQRIEYRRPVPDSLIASVYGAAGDSAPAFDVAYGVGECPAQ